MGAFFSFVLQTFSFMSNSFDFQVISKTEVPGISLVMAFNEDAFNYLTDEDITVMSNGYAAIDEDKVADFISDAGYAHLSCDYV